MTLAGDVLDFAGDEQDGEAFSAKLGGEGVNFGFRPDVDTSRGFVKDEHFGLRREPAGEHDLLLVASAEAADSRFHVRRGDPQGFDVLLGELALFGEGYWSKDSSFSLNRQGDILADAEVRDDAVVLSVFGHEAETGADRGKRRSKSGGLVGDGQRA